MEGGGPGPGAFEVGGGVPWGDADDDVEEPVAQGLVGRSARRLPHRCFQGLRSTAAHSFAPPAPDPPDALVSPRPNSR